ncbi:DUF5658 family protein [Paenibacillus glycanilyticus]|uniref:DUF5658 domain-containing protein n=1 Tax=Paenibacillus glycanilyticus TaxID=126569 RepID=A0ABQ6GF83_9BACL|nr:DUF5658 family protein [Paenibacillus glycanilyticus]GLX67991.1 hypothetical protein MU1_23360 [Paenibacillus glycanilyticus]
MSVATRLPIRSLLIGLLLFSLTDAIFTDIGIRLELITELNPFVSWLYNWHAIAYYGIKLMFPVLFMLLYPRLSSRLWIRYSAAFLFLLYLIVNLYHLVWVTLALVHGHYG